MSDQDQNRRGQVAGAVDALLQRHTFDRAEKLQIYVELLQAAAFGIANVADAAPDREAFLREVTVAIGVLADALERL